LLRISPDIADTPRRSRRWPPISSGWPARFGIPPLIPALIAAGWFAPSAAVYLGAANLAGYLAGALGPAGFLARRLGTAANTARGDAVDCTSLVACAFPLGFGWYFAVAFSVGGTGGVLMALAPRA